MDVDAARLASRRTALAAGLAGLTADELADDGLVAALATAPGFRPPVAESMPMTSSGHPSGGPVDALAIARIRRRTDLALILATASPATRADPTALADWLCGQRADLVHPMTGESMALLDWVNRGGPQAVALAVAQRG